MFSNAVPLQFGNQRANLILLVSSIADLVRRGNLDNFGFKFLLDSILHIDALKGTTDLTGVAERILYSIRCGQLQISVGKHNHRVFASEFQNQPLETLGAMRHDFLPNSRATCHGHHVYFVILNQPASHHTVALNDLQNIRRQCRRHCLDSHFAYEGGNLRWLHDDGIACREGRKSQ